MPAPREMVTPNGQAFISIRADRTQKRMVEEYGVKLRTWIKLERGRPVSYSTVAAMAERFAVPVDDLMVAEPAPQPDPEPTKILPEPSATDAQQTPDSPAVLVGGCGTGPWKSRNLFAVLAAVATIALLAFGVTHVLHRGSDNSVRNRLPETEQVVFSTSKPDDHRADRTSPVQGESVEPAIVATTDELVAKLEKSLLPSHLDQSRGVYRRNSPNGLGHDLWSDGTIRVTGVTIMDGEIEKHLQAAREIADAHAAETEQIDVDLTLSLDFQAISTGRRRLFLGPKLLANFGVGKWIDPEQNGSKMELFNEWTDAISTGKLIIDIDYQADGDDIIQAEMRITEQLDGTQRSDKYTRDVLIPLCLTPNVIKELASTGIRVPPERITGTATDTSRAGPVIDN